MKNLFVGTSGIFGTVPGLAIIVLGIGTPPKSRYLFGGVIEAFGALSILVLWANKGKIKRLSIRKISRTAIILGVVSFVSLILYFGLFQFCVISHPAHGTVYYPLWTSGRLAELVGRTGGRWEALDRYGKTPIYNAISQMPAYAKAITTALLLFVYQTIFTSLTIAFGLIGFRQGRDL